MTPSKPAPETVERVAKFLSQFLTDAVGGDGWETFNERRRDIYRREAINVIRRLTNKDIKLECERRGIKLLNLVHKKRPPFTFDDEDGHTP